MSETESRRARRYLVEAAAEVITPEATLESKTKNLSETGVCLVTKKMLPEGCKLKINIFLVIDGIEDISTPSLDIEAEVIWSAPSSEDEYLAGCQFLNISEKHLQILRNFLQHLEQ